MIPRASREDQKRRERAQFQRFVEICAGEPTYTVSQPLEPEPDVVLTDVNASIAVELTEIHPSGEQKRQSEGEQVKIVHAARSLYDATGLPPVHVFIQWAEGAVLSRANRSAAGRALFDLVVQNRPGEDGLVKDVEASEGFVHPLLPITAIMIAPASSLSGGDWRDGAFHEVLPPDAGVLQARVRGEEHKLDAYRERYTSKWLILVAGGAGPSTWTVVPDYVRQTVLRSRFDRVFLLLFDREKCYELQVTPESPA